MPCQHNLRWCAGSDLLQCSTCGYHCSPRSAPGMVIDLAMPCNNTDAHAASVRLVTPSAPSADESTQIPVVLDDVETHQSQADHSKP